MISVIIPTYNEAAVIEETLRRAAAALRNAGEDFEIVVVDDASADGTAERVESLAHDIPVRVLRRPGRLGLATAVLDGWAMARGDIWGVIDADLQHPPETLTALAAAIHQGADLAIGSRYVPGGGTSDWTWMRRFISRSATHMAATVLPLKLAAVGDPMSGMFMVRASALRNAPLNPLGYKILLEVIAKAHYNNLVEVPYVFQERERGASKLGARQYRGISPASGTAGRGDRAIPGMGPLRPGGAHWRRDRYRSICGPGEESGVAARRCFAGGHRGRIAQQLCLQ